VRLGGYELGQVLGEGGMGRVVRARHLSLGAQVAIKELTVTTPEQVELFRAEARLLYGLKHPSFPTVKDFFEEGGRFYLVMDLIEGEPLDRRIARLGPLDAAALAALWHSALEALAVLHAGGIVHRDVKPANLIVTPARVVLVDFGIARASSLTPRTVLAAKLALTPHFAPPEQYRGEPSSPAADLYALGATLFHAATARLPPDAPVRECADTLPPLAPLRPDLAPELAAAVTDCLALDPARRPASAAALLGRMGAPAPQPAPASQQALDTYARQRRLDIRRAPR
jgi:serine/threonine-protein kinase